VRARVFGHEGYHDQPDATAAVIDGEGWYHTGDLASMDARVTSAWRADSKT
jgi:long-subunit acyl-CoA synthetase (AMP-forming)